MKVAVCISGGLRDFRQCAASIREHLIDMHGADVYACVSASESSHDVRDFLKLYNVRTFIAVNNETHVHGFHKWLRAGTLCMWYKIDACQRLCDASGVVYDVVVRIRPDITATGPIIMGAPIARHICTNGYGSMISMPGDQVMYGDHYTMQIACSLIRHPVYACPLSECTFQRHLEINRITFDQTLINVNSKFAPRSLSTLPSDIANRWYEPVCIIVNGGSYLFYVIACVCVIIMKIIMYKDSQRNGEMLQQRGY